ncbi:MAG: hypothetical protein HQK77_19585 [Desulfobacterales bacterium]|nr:hypothetical protein [Desulfobacterales bacterium]
MKTIKKDLFDDNIEQDLEGQLLSQDVISWNEGKLLLQAGSVLTPNQIQTLISQRSDIQYVYIAAPDKHLETRSMSLSETIEQKLDETLHSLYDQSNQAVADFQKAKAKMNLIQTLGKLKQDNRLEMVSQELLEVVKEIVEYITKYPDKYFIATCVNLISERGDTFLQNSTDVMMTALNYGKHKGFPKKELVDLGISALLRDLGMTAIPKEILNKKQQLTEEERKIIMEHPYIGFVLLSNNGNNMNIYAYVAANHHKGGTKGYGIDSDILKNYSNQLDMDKSNIFLEIVKIADIYCGIKNQKVYHRKRNFRETMLIMLDDVYYQKVAYDRFIEFWESQLPFIGELFPMRSFFPLPKIIIDVLKLQPNKHPHGIVAQSPISHAFDISCFVVEAIPKDENGTFVPSSLLLEKPQRLNFFNLPMTLI